MIEESKPRLERNKLTMPPYGDWPVERITIIVEQDGMKYTKTYTNTPRVDVPGRYAFLEACRVVTDFELDRMKGRGKGAASSDQRPASAVR